MLVFFFSFFHSCSFLFEARSSSEESDIPFSSREAKGKEQITFMGFFPNKTILGFLYYFDELSVYFQGFEVCQQSNVLLESFARRKDDLFCPHWLFLFRKQVTAINSNAIYISQLFYKPQELIAALRLWQSADFIMGLFWPLCTSE